MQTYFTNVFDEDFKRNHSLKYFPWIGKNYTELKVKDKILIVAESVYNYGKDEKGKKEASNYLKKRNFAREIVKYHGLHFTCKDGVPNSKIARGIERAMVGKFRLSNTEKEIFWTSVSFHEFVQRPVEKGERPNKDDYELGTSVLKNVIEIVNPKICILFGNEHRKTKFFENVFLTKIKWPNNDEKINGSYPKIMNIDLGDNAICKVIAVKHPSSRFSWDTWYDFITANLPNKIKWLSNLTSG